MDHKRTTGWGPSRKEAALLGAIIGYGILVVVVTPLLLGFLPILAVGWMLRVPVASAPADSATVGFGASEPREPGSHPERVGRIRPDHAGLASKVRERLTTLAHRSPATLGGQHKASEHRKSRSRGCTWRCFGLRCRHEQRPDVGGHLTAGRSRPAGCSNPSVELARVLDIGADPADEPDLRDPKADGGQRRRRRHGGARSFRRTQARCPGPASADRRRRLSLGAGPPEAAEDLPLRELGRRGTVSAVVGPSILTYAFNFLSRGALGISSWRWRPDSLNPMAYPPSPVARSEHGAQPYARPRYDPDAATWSNM